MFIYIVVRLFFAGFSYFKYILVLRIFSLYRGFFLRNIKLSKFPIFNIYCSIAVYCNISCCCPLYLDTYCRFLPIHNTLKLKVYFSLVLNLWVTYHWCYRGNFWTVLTLPGFGKGWIKTNFLHDDIPIFTFSSTQTLTTKHSVAAGGAVFKYVEPLRLEAFWRLACRAHASKCT